MRGEILDRAKPLVAKEDFVDEGLAITFELLKTTDNEAAVRALIPALDSPDPAIQEGALVAILNRGTRRADERSSHACRA